MYRTFLSWRYLFARRTNLIGMVGIFVAVAALILIFSIMTGFLEESRRAVRGSQSDILIEPVLETDYTGVQIPLTPEAALATINAHPNVDGGTAVLLWSALFTQGGMERGKFQSVIQNTNSSGLLGVQVIGVDVRTGERLAQPILKVALAALGLHYKPVVIRDAFGATNLFESLVRASTKPVPGLSAREAVDHPAFPFATPSVVDPEVRRRGLSSIVVGAQFYSQLMLNKGDIVQLATVSPNSSSDEFTIVNREFVLAGVFSSGENESDLSKVYLSRGDLQDFLGTKHTYSQFLVRVKDYDEHGDQVASDLRGSLGDQGSIAGGRFARGEVRTWEEFRGNLLGAIENERVLMAIMLGLVLVVAGFTIFAILSMMVTEKRRDIGILSALGATRSGVLQTFLLIAFWDALIGSVFGALAGVWAAIKIDPLERWLSSYTERWFGKQIFDRQVYLFDHIPAIVSPTAVGVFVLLAFLCTLGFAFFPAWRAARQDPLEGLRYE